MIPYFENFYKGGLVPNFYCGIRVVVSEYFRYHPRFNHFELKNEYRSYNFERNQFYLLSEKTGSILLFEEGPMKVCTATLKGITYTLSFE